MNRLLEFASGSSPNETIIISLILLLVSSIALGLLFMSFVRRQVRAARLRRAELESISQAASLRHAGHASLFESPCRWLAIRSGNVQAVQEALHLHNATECSWQEGLAEARDRRLFISPPVGDWILVVGSGLPDPSDDVDKCFHFLRHLSREMGRVQFFSLNRVLHHHAWVRMEDGRVQRAYAWAGHTVWNQGRVSTEERALGLHCFGYAEAATRTDFTDQAPVAFNTEKVAALAARWSLDPAAIDDRRLGADPGITGEFSLSRPF